MNIPQAFIQLFAITLGVIVSPVIASEHLLLQKTASPDNIYADVVVDTRPLSSCRESTLSGAVCLPVEDIVAPQRRLANWSGILWLLGTAGLDGSEHVMLVGEQAERRELLAGVLFLAGQKQISIVDKPISSFISNLKNKSAGLQRSTTRIKVFTAPMRSELIVLRNELQQLTKVDAVILDGRSESEYFGATIRAQRGGHIPGAVHSPLSEWRKTPSPVFSSVDLPVVYAHDTTSGLQFFSTVLAAGQRARLYSGGWVEWAADGSLVADNVTYPHKRAVERPADTGTNVSPAETGNSPQERTINSRAVLLVSAIGSVLLGAGFLAGRHFSPAVKT